jgi:cytochrome c-type biogenesis protein
MVTMIKRYLILFALTAVLFSSAFLIMPGESIEPRTIDVYAPPPDGYIHRPLMEFFTGLSCPSCMGSDPDDDSPEKAVHDTYMEGKDDPAAPFSTIVFHELNGGGVDDLNNDEATERMRFYQPGLSGTPDVQFDGGYIEIGGFSASNKPIDQSTIDWALLESETRDENAPMRPIDRLRWNFPYVMMEVDQIFDGQSFYVEVKVSYESNAKTIGGNLMPLQGSLYVFMVEDNVTAYSLVYDLNVTNDAVFRGYAAEDERFSMNVGGEEIFSFSFDIPDAKIPIKPQDMYAVAAVFDTQDTDSSPGGTDGNQRANSPRAVQSATSRSTAYDRGNEVPEVKSISLVDKTVTVTMDDEGGIAKAFVFINTEGTDKPIWTPVELTLTGEEVCDDQGVCYAYSDASGTATLENYDGGALYAQVLLYDDQSAQSSSEVYSLVKADSVSKDKSSMALGISMGPVGLIIGIILIVIGPLLYFATRNAKEGSMKIFSKKATLAIFVALGIIITSVSASSVFTSSTTTVPDFTVTDTRGNVHSPETYEGKTLVLDIMFTTCASCNEEMPDLVEVYNKAKSKHGSDVEFLSVSVDNEDTDKMMNDFQSKYGAKWPIGLNRDFIEIFDALAVPKLLIIAPNGDIVFQHTGIIDKGEVLENIDDSVSGDYNTVSLTQSGGSLIAFGSMAALFGIVTFFSPCSLPMLPGYISYYITQESSTGKKQNPLKGGILAAVGIITFFVLVGILVAIIGGVIQQYLRFLLVPIGGLLIVLGFLTYIGKDSFMERGMDYVKKPFELLISKVRGRKVQDDSGSGSLFAYGFGYGAAASSCMAPAFIGMILISFGAGGLIGGAFIFGLYALSLGAMMVIFTYMAASGSTALQRFVTKTEKIKKISAILLMVAGTFVVIYALFLEKYLGSVFSFGF